MLSTKSPRNGDPFSSLSLTCHPSACHLVFVLGETCISSALLHWKRLLPCVFHQASSIWPFSSSSHNRLEAASAQDLRGKKESEERASLCPECGEDFIQNLEILPRQLTSWICAEEIPIFWEQRKLSRGYKSRTNQKLYPEEKSLGSD